MVRNRRVIGGRWACIASLFIICGSGLAQLAPARPIDPQPLFPYTAQRADLLVGDGPWWAAPAFDLGDLDGDGDLDAVCVGGSVQFPNSYLTVLLNKGTGVFEPAFGYEAGVEPTAIKLADMDGDANLDAVVANAHEDTVSIFPGVGDGTFGQRVEVGVGGEPRAIIIGDFDSDGDIDAATINLFTDDASILLNDGTGVLVLAQSVPVGGITPRADSNRNFPYPGPWHAAGDIDGDGDLDLAIPARSSIKFLLNDGDGVFELAPESVVTPSPLAYALALEDLDGDGDLDLAAVDSGSGSSTMDIWRNDGSGVFEHVGSYDSTFDPINIGIWYNTGLDFGDIDGDGDLDAAIATRYGEGAVIHRNNGDASFGPMEVLPSEWGPWGVLLRDIDDDGWLDHVSLPEGRPATLHTKLNDRAGTLQTFESAITLNPGNLQDYRSGEAGDLDGDGDLDMVFVGTGSGDENMRVLTNDGTGHFEITFAADFPGGDRPQLFDTVLVDLDDDDDLDVVSAVTVIGGTTYQPGAIWVQSNNGSGSFLANTVIDFDDFLPFSVHSADLNDDGHADVAVWGITPRDEDNPTAPVDRRVLILMSDGLGQLTTAGDYLLANVYADASFGMVLSLDLDGDGDLDLLASASDFGDTGRVYRMINDGQGVFEMKTPIDVPRNVPVIQVGDWDGDGDPDAAAMHGAQAPGRTYLTILDNDGAGNLSVTEQFFDDNADFDASLVAADLNGDGALDLVLSWTSLAGVRVHMNDGTGDFTSVASYSLAEHTDTVLAEDFDLDGDIDLLAAGSTRTHYPLMLLRGEPRACPADLTGSSDPREPSYGFPDGDADSDDFFFYLDAFASGNTDICDIDNDADCDAEDFFAYLDLFAAGC